MTMYVDSYCLQISTGYLIATSNTLKNIPPAAKDLCTCDFYCCDFYCCDFYC